MAVHVKLNHIASCVLDELVVDKLQVLGRAGDRRAAHPAPVPREPATWNESVPKIIANDTK